MFGLILPALVVPAPSTSPSWSYEFGFRPAFKLRVDGNGQKFGGEGLDLQYDVTAKQKDASGNERVVLKVSTKNEGRTVTNKTRNVYSATFRSGAHESFVDVPFPLDLQIKHETDETQKTLRETVVGLRTPIKSTLKVGAVDFSKSNFSVGVELGERDGTYLAADDATRIFRGVVDSNIVAALPGGRFKLSYTSTLYLNTTGSGPRSQYIQYFGAHYTVFSDKHWEISTSLRTGNGFKIPKNEPEAKTLLGFDFVYKT